MDVDVDSGLAGTATYGGSRPDVADDWPHAPSAIGYNFWLDTTSFANGPHTVVVRAIDRSCNVAVFPGRSDHHPKLTIPDMFREAESLVERLADRNGCKIALTDPGRPRTIPAGTDGRVWPRGDGPFLKRLIL